MKMDRALQYATRPDMVGIHYSLYGCTPNGIFEAFGIPVAMFEMDEEYLG